MARVLYLADFNLVACDFARFRLVVILKQDVKLFIVTVASVETWEELK